MTEATTETPTNSAPPALATPSRAQQVATALAKAAEKAKAALPPDAQPANDTAAAPKTPAETEKPAPEGESAADRELLKGLRDLVGRDPNNLKVLKDLLAFKNPTEAFIAIKQRTKALSVRERELERREAEALRIKQEAEELDTLRKTKPGEWAKRAGVSIRALAEAEVEAEPEEKRALRELREELASVKDQLSKRAETEQQTEAQRRDEYVTTDIQRHLSGELGEKYEYLHAFPAPNVAAKAWQMLQEYYAEHEEPLALESALDILEEEAKLLHESLSRSKERRRPPEKTAAPSERGNGAGQPAKPAAASDPPATLSNADVAERGGPPEKPKTPKEYRERAHLLAQRRAAAAKQ